MAFLKNLKLRDVLVPIFLGLLAAGYVGCGGRKWSSEEEPAERRVKGNVTYQRIPIKVVSTEETMPDESKVTVWHQSDYGFTDYEGNYTLILPEDDSLPAFVELQSVFGYSGTGSLRVVADPKGINSDVPQPDRAIYSMRKGLDGQAPDDDPMPAAAEKGDVQLDFEIGIEDKWWISHPSRSDSLKYAQ